MKEAQPIKFSDFVAIGKNDDASGVTGKDSPYVCVTDIYSNATEEVKIYYDSRSRKNEFRFFVVEDVEKRPYVSGVTAIDELTLYRGYGGADAGISRSDITNDMLLAQLANQGATNFNSHRVSLRQLDFWAFGGSISSYDELNAIKFGYRRTAEAKNALRDMFIYFNGFNTDEPPREIYKGEVKYTVLCEIPYNLTGYEGAPKIGIYLYGTTDSRAGNRIIDFEVSATPFMEGYETLRTYNGRTMVSEIEEYMSYHWFNHPMKWASEMFEALQDFFDEGGYTETEQNEYYYLHIKRENEDLREQKPYIESLMLEYSIFNAEQAIDRLCEWGADGYVAIDLNQGAGGDWVYLGYIRTADPDQAIREIRTYHTESGGYPGSTLTDGNGSVFNVVGPMDLNRDAGGDYIYLYTSKTATEKPPITDLGAVYSLGSSAGYQTWYDGTEAASVTYCVQKWESHTYSDLNEGAGGKTIYLNYTAVDTDYVGSGTVERDLGEDLLQSRDPYEDVDPNGKYIGGLYIMDKETVMNELIAAGELPNGSICDCITDQQVYDRLQEMGATTVIKTPMTVTGKEYFSSNTNQVFIGYSRTNKSSKAIKNIAFKVEILSTSEPKERIEIGGKAYKLVAEAASEVESLPTAINILGVHGYHDKLLPRMYLYYSTAGNGDPIYDFSIDGDPLKNGWVTVRSAGGVDPFEEIATKAYEQYELAAKDDGDSYDSELVYSDPLYAWMEDVYELFTPSKSNIKPFFLHVKKYTEPTIEEIKPYIGEIFVAEGANMHEALSKLIKYEPDGYVDCDLNRDAGGRKVYVAYKRVAKAKDAIRDLAIYQGSDPEYVRRININGSSIKYTLVGDVDLNSKAGGKYLYLYYADSNKTGNPIKNITITEKIDNYLKCGVERATVKRADGNAFTSEYIDLNKRAGGDYLYMIMHRESAEGHRKSELLKVIEVDPTCGEEGSVTNVYQCLDCKSSLSEVTVVSATGKHFDEDGDWDHDCDECYKSGLSPHVAGEPVIEDLVEATEDEDGYYLLVYYCAECEEWLSESEGIIPAGTEFDEERMIASLLGNGSPIAIYFLCGVAILAAIFVFFMKKKSY